jgi:hypothetical protein
MLFIASSRASSAIQSSMSARADSRTAIAAAAASAGPAEPSR